MNWQAKKAQSQLRNALPGGAIFQLSWAPLTLRNQWQPASNSAMFAGSLFRRSFGSGGLGTIFTKQVYLCNINIFIHISPCLSIYLSIDLSIYLSIHPSIYRSIDLSIYRSIYLSIYLSISLWYTCGYIYRYTCNVFTFGHIGTFSQHWLNVRYDEKGPSPEELSCEAPSQCWDTTRNFSRHLAEPLYVFPPALSVAGTLQNIASTGSCCTNTWETWGILNVTYHYIPIHTHIYI